MRYTINGTEGYNGNITFEIQPTGTISIIINDDYTADIEVDISDFRHIYDVLESEITKLKEEGS